MSIVKSYDSHRGNAIKKGVIRSYYTYFSLSRYTIYYLAKAAFFAFFSATIAR